MCVCVCVLTLFTALHGAVLSQHPVQNLRDKTHVVRISTKNLLKVHRGPYHTGGNPQPTSFSRQELAYMISELFISFYIL